MPRRVCYNWGSSMPVSASEFRAALRHFPAGVTVVTTRDAQDQPCGLTVSAFTSLSLEPPLVLVCVDRGAVAHPAFEAHGWFAVNLLGKSQDHLAQRFALSASDKFAGVAYREGLARLPVLDDAVAALECRLVQRYAGGDHDIFVGRVEGTRLGGGTALVYYQSRYHHLETDPRTRPPARDR